MSTHDTIIPMNINNNNANEEKFLPSTKNAGHEIRSYIFTRISSHDPRFSRLRIFCIKRLDISSPGTPRIKLQPSKTEHIYTAKFKKHPNFHVRRQRNISRFAFNSNFVHLSGFKLEACLRAPNQTHDTSRGNSPQVIGGKSKVSRRSLFAYYASLRRCTLRAT